MAVQQVAGMEEIPALGHHVRRMKPTSVGNADDYRAGLHTLTGAPGEAADLTGAMSRSWPRPQCSSKWDRVRSSCTDQNNPCSFALSRAAWRNPSLMLG